MLNIWHGNVSWFAPWLINIYLYVTEIQNRMREEKNKLRYMHELVREKQAELSGVIQYSKIQDMENRLVELKKEAVETDRKLHMLEGIRKKQVSYIDR